MATPTVPGLIGIKNHGNTCFINIIVQCLGHTEQILHYILSGQCQRDVAALRKGKKKVPSVLQWMDITLYMDTFIIINIYDH